MARPSVRWKHTGLSPLISHLSIYAKPEICHVVYIKSVEFNSTSIPPYAFPFLHDTIAAPPDVVSSKADLAATTDDGGLYELPTCPVCLERMDASVTGLLTILCQHTFHCHCLSKWGDGR
ncbi:hypothetical protein BC938DRAFT_473103 [Jimgerdemannia flammicorona]|uniref:RING-type domain-containing protein n=1 Tax=Jimgerdemannia flammicorona TaxID=994334 RepID=A0A433Q4U5_9FUNG|nr:hypothetical protein BC938DRAFT_473103 [Jimgerdemannia flammicorona]